jgi:transcriptional regulator with XRE-family HTH domain
MQSISERMKWTRKLFGWLQADLADVSGVGLHTIRRIEQGDFEPRLETVRRLAEALYVREGWLAFGEAPMVGLHQMTEEEQVRAQTGPGTEGLPGFVVVRGGPWFREGGEWRVDRAWVNRELQAAGRSISTKGEGTNAG